MRIVAKLAEKLRRRAAVRAAGKRPVLRAAEHEIPAANGGGKVYSPARIVKKRRTLLRTAEKALAPAEPDRLHGRHGKAMSAHKLLCPAPRGGQIVIRGGWEYPRGRDLKAGKAQFLHQRINARIVSGFPRNI